MKKFNLNKLLRDLGGCSHVAAALDISRTTPYRWAKTDRISVENLERLKSAFDFSVDDYFEDDVNERTDVGSTDRLS